MSEDAGASPQADAGSPQTSGRAARHRARALALQGIYQWLLSGNSVSSVQAHLEAEGADIAQLDHALFASLLRGAIAAADDLRASFAPLLSRPVAELSPVEHAILLLGAHELRNDLHTPYRVVINEAIELAKEYGGTDGHRFVNGVLDKLAAQLRPEEARNRRRN